MRGATSVLAHRALWCVVWLPGCIEPNPGYGDGPANGAGAGSTSGSGPSNTAGSTGSTGTGQETTPDDGASSGTSGAVDDTSGGGGTTTTDTNGGGGTTTTETNGGGGTTTTETSSGGETTTTETTGGGVAPCSELWAEPGWTLTPPEAIPINTSQGDLDPFLSADGLTLYFASTRPGGPGGADLYVATRPTLDAPFGNVQIIPDVNSGENEASFAVFGDAVTALLVSNRSPATSHDVWSVSRADTGASWEVGSPVAELTSSGDDWDVFVTRDGLLVAWSPSTGGPRNLVYAERASVSDPFGAAEPFSVNTDDADDSPTLSEDRLLLVFASQRPGAGGKDLWYATRDDPAVPFGTPAPVPGVNTSDGEGEAHLRADGCELIFTSTRPSGMGLWDLYRTTFVPP